ncbi:myosin-X [Capsaspora owczarzaki ATCC 30864]|uniref:Myosin-X n=1 Tax=Capsaspora owczarzaki (strain ATCC 30864) TaxID=595528 RepID=A0A0D2WKQ2_CAPO3|nr:myosin-X [Capsaspora owczarzaki ATCC 30864]KJE90233.1 myosin-X [Capsaspora owczarzaki ATCC 30864]|eukprot:XP_004364442.2 myosin-X [Capsaspora owczarzaki ATCC 30864]
MPNLATDGVEDMTTIDQIDENGINTNLKVRYNKDLIYTYTGSILVAVNPYKFLKIFENDTVKQYAGKRVGDLPPHIFAISESTYDFMKRTDSNQSVIISGESGAGKTESTKLILQYLTAVTQNQQWIEQQIMETNTLLEAFGNAKTVRNNNSSRFGKFMQVCFDSSLQIKGLIIEDYLLEQSRVVFQAESERNYHVFYQLCAACASSPEDKAKFLIDKAESYAYTNKSGCIKIDDVDDKKDFDALRLAMTVLNISPENQDSIFSLLAAILIMSNLKFQDVDGETISFSADDMKNVGLVAKLLKIDEAGMKKAFAFRQLQVRDNVTEIPLKHKEALDNRDSAAKALYSRTFTWLVRHINTCTNPGANSGRFIGVLDIFGFENFAVNSFEQLCINYTNEKLHKFFNHYVFSLEQEEYAREGINIEQIKWVDNQATLDLVEKPPTCILKFLDEECRFPKGSDATYLEKQNKALSSNEWYHMSADKREHGDRFGVKHYAGTVIYMVNGFLDKNKDVQQDMLFGLMGQSGDDFVKGLCKYRDLTSIISGMSPEEAAAKASKGGKPTVGGIFKDQLASLVNVLSKTQPWYVRCIKPNMVKKAGVFDDKMVLDQLSYSGMLDIIRIRKLGYPIKIRHGDFVQRFKCLAPKLKLTEDMAGCTTLANTLNLGANPQEYQVGKTKIVLKERVYFPLDDRRVKMLDKLAIIIQKRYKGWLDRKAYQRKRWGVIQLQRFMRGFIHRLRYKRKVRAIITIQAGVRGWFARDLYRFLKRKKAEEEEKKKREAEAAADRAAKEAADKQQRELIAMAKMAEAKAAKAAQDAAAAAGAEAGAPPVAKGQAGLEGVDLDNIFSFLGVEDEEVSFANSFANELDDLFETKVQDDPETRAKYERMAKRAEMSEKKAEQLAEQKPPEEPGDPTFVVYAEKHCNKHPKDAGLTGTLSLRKKKDSAPQEWDEMLSYTKATSIPTSIVKLSDNDHITLAVSIFKDLVKFMRGELKAEQERVAVQNIITIGVAKPELRDEIYIQIFKQLISNPKEDQVARLWNMLSFCSVTFPPSNSLYKHVQAYLNSTKADANFGKRAEWCGATLKKIKLNGARKSPPSALELQAVQNLSCFICRFFFLDGKSKAVSVEPSSTAQDVLKELAEKINLHSTDGWALYEESDGNERAIKGTEYIADTLARWESERRTSNTTKSNTLSKKKDSGVASMTGDARFVFKKRLFKNPKEVQIDPVEYHYIYWQAVHGVCQDFYPVTDKIALQLAGLQAQINWGEHETGKDSRYEDLEFYLPERLINNVGTDKKRTREEWQAEIGASHRSFGAGKTELQAKVMYLTAIKQFAVYGSTLYNVVYKGFWSHPNKIYLGVDHEGFKFVNVKTKAILVAYKYEQLQNMELDSEEDQLTLTLKQVNREEQQSFIFETPHKEEIASLISSYSPVHRHWTSTSAARIKEVRLTDADLANLLGEVREARKKLARVNNFLRKPEGQSGGFIAATLRRLPSTKGKKTADKEPDYEKIYKKDWWVYTKSRIPTSLTLLEGEDVETALKMFASLLIYGGLAQNGGFESEDDTDRSTMVQMVLAKCLEKDSLCNEFFLQLIKQTTDQADINSKSNLQAWRFLCLAVCVLVPRSDAVLEYLRVHLKRCAAIPHTEEGKFAQYAQQCLARTVENKNRKYPPSRQEIIQVTQRQKIHARFHFLDGQFRALFFDSAATTQEVVDLVKERIGLKKDVQGFSLFEVFGPLERNMLPSEKVADAIFKWEKYAKSTHSNKSLRLTFKQRLFTGPFSTPADPVEFNLVFHQAIDDVVGDRFPVTTPEAVRLAALRAQVELGDCDKQKPAADRYSGIIEKYIPKHMRTSTTLANEISEEHIKLVGKQQQWCDHQYFDFVKSWSLYGSTIFEVLQSYTSSLPKNLWLAVNEHGIHILKRKEKDPLVSYNYRNIVNYSPSLRNLMIVTESLTRGTKFVFNTSQASQIAHLIRDYTHIIVQKQKNKAPTK